MPRAARRPQAAATAWVGSLTASRIVPSLTLAPCAAGQSASSLASAGKAARGTSGVSVIALPEYRRFSSSGVPRAMTLPWSMIAIRSQSWSASSR